MAGINVVNRKYRRLVATIFLMVLLGGAQPFLWSWVNQQALHLQQQRSQDQQIANVINRNAEVKQRLTTTKEFLNQLEVVSPPTTSKTQVVERIEQLADQLGLQIDITVIQELATKETTGKEAHVIPVSMSVATTGTTAQLLRFMDRVEHTQELSVVSQWALEPGPPPAVVAGAPVTVGPAPYTLTMDIFFYLRKVDDAEK